MKRLCASFMILLILILSFPSLSQAEDFKVNFLVNGKNVSFKFDPLIRDGITYVDAKTLAAQLSLTYTSYPSHESFVISNRRTSICFVPYDEHATVADFTGTSDSEYHYRILNAPCIYIGGTPAVAARDIADVFGYALSFNQDANTVYFGYSPEMISSVTRNFVNGQAYYFQNQAEFNLPSNGSGYCWVCSYAMLMTNVLGYAVTPTDVAAVNLAKSSSGAYCYHKDIVAAYDLKFVDALSPNSPYFGGRDSGSGGTYINNPSKDDAITRAALKEALTLHPEGVMVRYAQYPHTMVAVAYEGDVILFNDPAPLSSSTYTGTSRYQGVPFSETCVAMKGFSLSDVTFIQALSK